MADVVVAIVQKAVDVLGLILRDQVFKGHSNESSLQEHVSWIETELRHIQCSLKDAENKKSEGERITNWVNDVRDLAYDLEDVMDSFLPKIASHGKSRFQGCFGSVSLSCATSQEFVRQIERIKRRVEEINQRRTRFGLTQVNDRGGDGGQIEEWDPRQSFPHVDEPNIIGFEERIEKLAAIMLDLGITYRILSIVGMAGLGKTTLAKKVYNSIKEDFDCHAWLYVSQQPKVRSLLQGMAKQLGMPQEMWEGKVANVEQNVYEFLKKKRYLIVFDDLWNTEAWDAFKTAVPLEEFCTNGSRLILTSRNSEVGLYAGGDSSLHKLEPLNWENSWGLFSKMVMTPLQTTGETTNFLELKKLGEEIVQKCGGVPLAIVVAAGILLMKARTVQAWDGVLKKIGRGEDSCSKILALSYSDLGSSLKPCFLYFGLFPEDHAVPTNQLINMWVADGFIQAQGEQTPEDIGEDYVNELVNRNLIQVADRRFDGRVKSCRIHDLLHSLCTKIAEEQNFFKIVESVNSSPAMTVRRTTILLGLSDYISLETQTPKVRALLCFNGGGLGRKQLRYICDGFRVLRVLCIEGIEGSFQLPDAIGSLFHLKYLGFEGGGDVGIPSTICNLKNLQTLHNLSWIGLHLPHVVWKMKQLRHIISRYRFALFRQPSKFKHIKNKFQPVEVCLPNLETLFKVDGDTLHPDYLQHLTSLRKLGLNFADRQSVGILTSAASIAKKLENIRLEWRESSSSEPALNLSLYQNLRKTRICGILEKLPNLDEFPPNLTVLALRDTRLRQDSLEILAKLPKLKSLKLSVLSYSGTKLVFPGASSFPRLEEFKLGRLPNLTELKVEEGGMPRLKLLRIYRCDQLVILSDRLKSLSLIAKKFSDKVIIPRSDENFEE